MRIAPSVALIEEVCIREWIGIRADAKTTTTTIASKPNGDVFAVETSSIATSE